MSVSTRPYDPRRPPVCLDETSQQWLEEKREPLPPAPGQPARQDCADVRQGVANLFLAGEPRRGWRQVSVTQRRPHADFAHVIQDLLDVRYPTAACLVLVLDNLNLHAAASLSATFPPAEARRRWEKLEVHSTPKHGSGLDSAEIELSALCRQCRDRRLPDLPTVRQEVAAWEAERNAAQVISDWRFTTADNGGRPHQAQTFVPVTSALTDS